ncbi:LAETG motif-containing sortase-dependent surface protein [Streptomyces regalis]|uniref:Gram-positive cocci surface proteins LPxTG domain-containing protein n=1 Tax=Streptomyces regalis TaxID=68262 RepID=A0A117MKT7_9ACTN|nr:LAETG motif-containing sortase-dependent surface protein [Streptomyces regalis]KUL22704.1 hypothetical protein ADL12_41680 [Streptomyces regalis]
MTVTVTNAKTATDSKPDPSDKPTHTPSTPGKPSSGTGGAQPSSPGTGTPDADSSSTAAAALAGDSTPKAPAGSLAYTGADATPWIAAGAGLLAAAGAGALVATRRRRMDESNDDGPTEDRPSPVPLMKPPGIC